MNVSTDSNDETDWKENQNKPPALIFTLIQFKRNRYEDENYIHTTLMLLLPVIMQAQTMQWIPPRHSRQG